MKTKGDEEEGEMSTLKNQDSKGFERGKNQRNLKIKREKARERNDHEVEEE